MGEVKCSSTVFFDAPFWVAIFERYEDGKLYVSKVTFGVEPKDYDIYEFVLKHYYELQYSPAVETHVKEMKKNPKRMQREIRKSLEKTGVGNKSWQALKLQHEQNKLERKATSRAKKKAEADRKYELKQQKKKEKRRGR
ncbi:MAG: YjdF family protein [Clostridia bacterium]|nr:YjdF family protein [Clostridia bacterium]